MKGFVSRRSLVVVLLIAISTGALLSFSNTFDQMDARAQEGLNNSSIDGIYAAYSTAETRATINGSVLSVAEFDGAGSWTSTILRNTAVSSSERDLESLSSFGTYVLHSTGMGNAHAATAAGDNASNDANFDFVVTQTETTEDGILVTEFYALPRLSSTGRAAGVTFKRLANSASFNNSSLRGQFGVTFFVGNNESAGLGTLSFNGLGEVSGSLLSNEAPSSQAGTATHYLSCLFPCLIGEGEEVERQISVATVRGTYAIQSDARGTMSLQSQTGGGSSIHNQFNLLITQVDGSTGLITELIALQQEPAGTSGGLRALYLTRISM